MAKPKKELIKEIADLFEDYREPYASGEWEKFASQQKKAKQLPVRYAWAGVAALLALAAGMLPVLLQRQDKQLQHPAASVPPGAGVHPQGPTAGNPVHPESRLPAALSFPAAPGQAAVSLTTVKPADYIPADSAFLGPMSPAGAILPARTAVRRVSGTYALLPGEKTDATLVFLQRQVQQAGVKQAAGAADKWNFGLAVSPALGNTGMKMGAGLTTAYRLSGKLALSSGISLMQLGSGKSYAGEPVVMAAFAQMPSKELSATEASLKVIDIPLDLVYTIRKNYYLSAGVSYVNVLKEKRSNTFIQTSQVSYDSAVPGTPAGHIMTRLVREELDEPVAEQPLQGNGYLGFVNFSAGHVQQLSGRYRLEVAPFIKVPVGKLSQGDLKLVSSGLKVQLAF